MGSQHLTRHAWAALIMHLHQLRSHVCWHVGQVCTWPLKHLGSPICPSMGAAGWAVNVALRYGCTNCSQQWRVSSGRRPASLCACEHTCRSMEPRSCWAGYLRMRCGAQGIRDTNWDDWPSAGRKQWSTSDCTHSPELPIQATTTTAAMAAVQRMVQHALGGRHIVLVACTFVRLQCTCKHRGTVWAGVMS